MVRRRPLVWLTLAWALGVLIGRELAITPFIVWLIMLGLFIGAVASLRLQNRHWQTLLLWLVVGLGALFYLQARLPVERLYPLLDGLKTVRGTVSNYPAHRPERSSFVLDPEDLPGSLQIFYYHPYGAYKPIHYGDLLEIEARFWVPWQFEDFDYREYLRTRGIWGVGSLWSAKQIRRLEGRQGHPLLQWGYRARLYLFEFIDRHVPDPGGALLKGLLFGERAYLSEEIEAGFRDAGVMHVLAVSGLHLGILIGLFWAFLRLLRLSATQIYLSLIPLVVMYLAIVGFKASMMRASLMFAFVALGWVVAERGLILRSWIDPLQGLSAAALVILVSTPQALFDVSFQLSFAATLGIVIALQFALPRWQAHSNRLRAKLSADASLWRRTLFKLGEMVGFLALISAAAQLAVAPVLVYHFHRVYLGALLANLIVVPLVTAALWLGVFVLLAGAIITPLAQGLGALEGQVLMLLIHATQSFAKLPWAYLVIDRGMQLAAIVVLPLILSPYALKAFEMALWQFWLKFGLYESRT